MIADYWMNKKKTGRDLSLFATNHKARRDYEIIETFEAGIQLLGTEIKSIRQRRVSIDDSFARRDWAWKESFDIDAMTKDMILNLKKKNPSGKSELVSDLS